MIAALVLFAAPSPAAAPDLSPQALASSTRLEQRLGEPLPLDAAFKDEAGEAVRLGDYFGKQPVLLAFVYYDCPMLCTLTLNGLVRALRVLSLRPGTDFQVVTLSFDPAEPPELAAAKKKTYLAALRRPGAADGWHFLTGDRRSIERVTEAAGFHYVYDPRSGQYAHSTGLVVATPDGRLSRYLYGVEFPASDLRLSLIEASQGRLGSLSDVVLLLCFHYDPAQGTYSLAILRILKGLGAITLAALAGGIGLALRRERAGGRA